MYFRRAIEGSSLFKGAVPCQTKGPRQWLQAYSSNRLSKIEMRIDPAKPRPLEKKRNMPLNVTDVSLVPITVPLDPPRSGLRISVQPVAVTLWTAIDPLEAKKMTPRDPGY